MVLRQEGVIKDVMFPLVMAAAKDHCIVSKILTDDKSSYDVMYGRVFVGQWLRK